jgi:hypothetical protein
MVVQSSGGLLRAGQYGATSVFEKFLIHAVARVSILMPVDKPAAYVDATCGVVELYSLIS